MLGSRLRDTLDRLFAPVVVPIAKTGVSPSAITLAGPILGTLVCLWFVRTQAVLPFCVAITAVGCLDSLDGMVARASGRTSKFGGYLDAICDRYFEAIVVLTVASVTGYWALSMVALAGAMLVSYTKARAALEVVVSNREWPDLMARGERIIVYVVGLAVSSVVPWRPLGHDVFWWTLVLLSVLIHLTVVQRVLRARQLIGERK